MKREVEREIRLPAFALQLGEIELLWQRMQKLFNNEKSSYESIELSLPSERLNFDSLDELKDYAQIRGRVTNFSLKISQENISVVIKTGGIFSNVPTLRVIGDSDIWCAGAIEAVMSVIQRNRLWYWWILRLPTAFLFFIGAFGPYIFEEFFSKKLNFSTTVAITWIVIVLILGFIVLLKEKLLPAAALVFTNDLGFIRKYGAEIGLVLGVVSLVATFLMPFLD